MERSILALLLLLLLIIFEGMTATTNVYAGKEMQASLEAVHKKHHKHKHSGFSSAECPGACGYRCSATAYKKPCMFFCQKCCFKCRCVPPGTYGNKEVCACYNNWKTKRGGPKCP